jgi:hypothetical protein
VPRRATPFFFQGARYTNAGGSRTKLAVGRENSQAAEDALLDHLSNLRSNWDAALDVSCEQFVDAALALADLEPQRPRGRPRKTPAVVDAPKKPRGRLRKAK